MTTPPIHPLHIGLVGPSRFGIGEPFAGGLEAHTASLVRALHARGHRLSVFAGPEGDDPLLPVPVRPVVSQMFDHEFVDRRDTTHPSGFCTHESERYRAVVDRLRHVEHVDVVHNNSLHPAVVDADPGDGSFVHVLHCPPFPKLAAAHRRLARRAVVRGVVAVSNAVTQCWDGLATDVIHNGVDVTAWSAGADQPRHGAVWAGRFVEEKAPHLAIRAAKLAGVDLRLAGPIGDSRYFDRYVRRELGASIQWVGPQNADDLAALFRSAEVGIVSPIWNEPFCLVAAEMLAAGTPVAAFARGGLSEVVPASVGALATAADPVSLADAIRRAMRVSSPSCVEHVRRNLSSAVMVDRYVEMYRKAASHPGRRIDDRQPQPLTGASDRSLVPSAPTMRVLL